jgi:hypothetical protein
VWRSISSAWDPFVVHRYALLVYSAATVAFLIWMAEVI